MAGVASTMVGSSGKTNKGLIDTSFVLAYSKVVKAFIENARGIKIPSSL